MLLYIFIFQIIEPVQSSEDSHTSVPHCPLKDLNLSHNKFSSVPPMLACVCVCLQKLNISYNNLRYVSPPSLYPASLSSLDLSFNNIQTHVSYDFNDSDDGTIISEKIADFKCYSIILQPTG